ncbi:MAG: NIPSNAP family protein, partial [Variovorax sp.]
ARDSHPAFGAYLAASGHLITAQETRLIRAVSVVV